MLKELKFVQGAVAKKDLVPGLTHFAIDNGRVRSFNGTLSLCSPIALDLACKPDAGDLIAAIGACEETVQLSMTPKGRLSIKSGKYKALINCVSTETPHPEPEGETVVLDGVALLAALKAVWPFVGDDASRVWTNGVLLRDNSAFATNNVCVAEYWIGTAFPHVVNLPRAAVKEMLRINEAPTHAQMVPDSNITFHYSDGRWLRTQLITTAWPDLQKILAAQSAQAPVPKELFVALDVLKNSVDKMGRVFFKDGCVSTHDDVENADATYEVQGLPPTGIYSFEMLKLLKDVAVTADFSLYPSPCMFMGANLRGAIVGMRGV